MKKSVTGLLFISQFFLIASCGNKDERTIEFISYLENFNMKAKNGEFYLFVPSDRYQNWFVFDGKYLSPHLNKKLHIFSGFAPINVKSFANYHYDKESRLQDLKFIDYSNKLVIFEKEKIQNLVEFVTL